MNRLITFFIGVALLLSACSPQNDEQNNVHLTDGAEQAAQSQNSNTSLKCRAIDEKEYPQWKCYEVTGAYTVLYPTNWSTSGQGDAGVFAVGDIQAIIDYYPLDSMSAQNNQTLQKGGIDSFIEERYRNFCGQTETCPKLIEKTFASMAGKDVTLHHYQMSGSNTDPRGAGYDQYTMGFISNDRYFLMILSIPLTTSRDESEQRKQEFLKMADSLVVLES